MRGQKVWANEQNDDLCRGELFIIDLILVSSWQNLVMMPSSNNCLPLQNYSDVFQVPHTNVHPDQHKNRRV